MIKNYLLEVLQQCSEERFGQDAIEWAIVSGLVHLSYDLDTDIHEIMLRYDEIIEAYRRSPAQAHGEPVRAPMARAVRRRAATGRRSSTATGRKKAA